MKGDEKEIKLKEDVLLILERFPFYKYAAKINRISEDTLKRMRNDDPEFADRCEASRASGLMKYANKAKPEFLLSCAEPETFKEHKSIEVSGEPLIIIKESDGNKTKQVADGSVE
jgi:hypothetical protein